MTSVDGLLAGAPSLPGARCRGRPHLFEEAAPGESRDATTARHSQAVELCARCPALDACTTWLQSLPPRDRPAGITAGQRHPLRGPGRPRKEHTNT